MERRCIGKQLPRCFRGVFLKDVSEGLKGARTKATLHHLQYCSVIVSIAISMTPSSPFTTPSPIPDQTDLHCSNFCPTLFFFFLFYWLLICTSLFRLISCQSHCDCCMPFNYTPTPYSNSKLHLFLLLMTQNTHI